MSGAAAAAAAAAAAEQKRRQDEEEQELTEYSKKDMDDWEFKIVRANLNAFKNSDTLKKVIDEESKAGWIFLEKFDDHRIRFKRKISERQNDSKRDIDPYRTEYGISQWAILIFIILGIFVFIIVLMAIFAR